MFLRIHRQQTDLQLFHILLKAARPVFHLFSAGIGPVLCSLLPVLSGDHRCSKICFIYFHHGRRQIFRSRRELRHFHFRKHLPYHLPLRFTVIEKDKRIGPQVQFFRYFPDIVRFRIPVDPLRSEILRAKHHMGMMLQDLHGIRFVILGRNGQEHTLTLHDLQYALQIFIGQSTVIFR